MSENNHKYENKTNELHVILGISGNTGIFVAKRLLELGYKVRGISRSGNKIDLLHDIEVIKANALNFDELKNAINGATTIYHCLGLPYPEWFSKHPLIMQNLIQAASANKPQTKIVFVDNLYAYGKKGAELGPINEKTPELATDKKGLLRKELTKMLFEAQAQGLIAATVGRASDFFGPYSTNSVLDMFVLPAIVKNKPAKLFANLQTNHSWIYLPDFANSIVVLGTQDASNGKIWIVPHFETMTIKDFVTKFYEENGVNIPIKVKSRPMIILKIASLFNKTIREYSKMNYQRTSDWIVDDSQFKATFTDWKSTDMRTAFNETVSSYKKQKAIS